MDCLSRFYRIFRLFSALWLILDIILHIILTEQYFILSPSLYNYHEANTNLSERILKFCTNLNQAEFNQSLMNQKQKDLHDDWIEKCEKNNFSLTQDSLQEQEEFVEVSIYMIDN